MGHYSATGRVAALNEVFRGSVGGGGDGPEALAARLTWIFADQTAAATPEQRQAVLRWQGRDRFYEQVQLAVMDDNAASDDARDVADHLTSLAAPLTQSVEVWRGIRSIVNTFGVPAEQLATLVGDRFEVDRFVSTTVDRRVAKASSLTPRRHRLCTRSQFRVVRMRSGYRRWETQNRLGSRNCSCFQASRRVLSRWKRQVRYRSSWWR